MAQVAAKGKGIPELPLVVLPFPYDRLTEQKIHEITREQTGSMLKAVTAKPAPPIEAR